MKRNLQVIVFWLLCCCFVFFGLVRIAYASSTVVELRDDVFRILPVNSPLNIMANDTIENLPQLGWIFEIGQNREQGAKFSFFESHLRIVDPIPGRYEFTYILSWPEGKDSAKVYVTVLNADGSDPPPPNPSMFLPFLKTE